MRIKNYDKYQHHNGGKLYPWIKLHRTILDDLEWHELQPDAAKILVMLWLLASEKDGELPDVDRISFRLRMAKSKVIGALSQLEHWIIMDDCDQGTLRVPSGYPEGTLDKIRVDRDQDRDKRESKGTQGVPCAATNDNGKVTHEQVQAVVDYWNAQAALPAARGISAKRDKAIRGILKDAATRDCWQDSIDAVTTSEFHLGKNERGWKITFDWWCKPDKVLQFAERGPTERVDKHGNAVTIETDVDELGF